MATLEILGEPKELNLTQSKNILVNQDYSETINNEFNKVLQDARSGNSYEKRLEMLNEYVPLNSGSSYDNSNFRQEQEYTKSYEKNNYDHQGNNWYSSPEKTASASYQQHEKVNNEFKSKDNSEKNSSREEKNKTESNTGNIDAKTQIAAMLNANIAAQNRVKDFSRNRSENRSEKGQINYLHNNNIRRETNPGVNQNARAQSNGANGLNNAISHLNNNLLNNNLLNNNLSQKQGNITAPNSNQAAHVKNNNQNSVHNNMHAAAKANNDINHTEKQNNKARVPDQTIPENLQRIMKDENVMVTVNSQNENQKSVQDRNSNTRNKNIAEKSAAKIDLNDNAKAMTTKLNLQQNSSEANLNGQNNQGAGEQIALKADNQQLYNGQIEVSTFKTPSFDKVLEANQAKQVANTSVMDQITQKTSELSSNAPSNITIALNPENLGKVEINLVSQNGNLTAQITTENSKVKEELTKGLDDLKQNLINQGVNVDKLVVSVQEPATSNNNYSNLQQDQSFSQFDQSRSESNNNPDSSRQTSHQEGSNSYANSNNAGIEEETTQNTVSNDDNYISSGRAMPGRVDYLI